MHTTIKKTPTYYSKMLDHLSQDLTTTNLETGFLCVSPVSINLSDFARSLAFYDSFLPELGFRR